MNLRRFPIGGRDGNIGKLESRVPEDAECGCHGIGHRNVGHALTVGQACGCHGQLVCLANVGREVFVKIWDAGEG